MRQMRTPPSVFLVATLNPCVFAILKVKLLVQPISFSSLTGTKKLSPTSISLIGYSLALEVISDVSGIPLSILYWNFFIPHLSFRCWLKLLAIRVLANPLPPMQLHRPPAIANWRGLDVVAFTREQNPIFPQIVLVSVIHFIPFVRV